MSSTQLLWAARFVLTIVLVLNVAPVQALTPGEVRDAAKDAVVYLRVTGAGQNGVPYEVDATGFLVSTTGELITAHHIIKDKDGRPLTNLKIEGWPGSRYDVQRAIEVLYEEPNLNLMLLRFKGNKTDYKTVSICLRVSLNDGDPLVAVGFPRGSELSVINGILSNRSGDRGWYTTNVDFMQGYSGGPVFDQKTGSVVGIVMGGTPEVAGRNFFLPISRAKGLLSQLSSEPPCHIRRVRVWVHYTSEGQKDAAQKISSILRDTIYNDEKIVSPEPRFQPTTLGIPQIRYFNAQDRDDANKIGSIISRIINENINIVYLRGYNNIQLGWFEIWLPNRPIFLGE